MRWTAFSAIQFCEIRAAIKWLCTQNPEHIFHNYQLQEELANTQNIVSSSQPHRPPIEIPNPIRRISKNDRQMLNRGGLICLQTRQQWSVSNRRVWSSLLLSRSPTICVCGALISISDWCSFLQHDCHYHLKITSSISLVFPVFSHPYVTSPCYIHNSSFKL